MLSSSRRLRAEQARARLLALGPRWVPTPDVVEAELGRLESGGAPPTLLDEPTPNGADWVPERRRVPALLVLLAGGVVGSAMVWLLAVPRGEAVPEVTLSAPTTVLASPTGDVTLSTEGATSAATACGVPPAGSAGVVVVDVQGAVHRPGVVELPTGSRVVDALAAVGGATRRAVTTTLNLAQVLVDGAQVLVPDRRSAVSTSSAGSSTGAADLSGGDALVNLNTATVEQLDSLPGIGPVLAQRILDYRAEHGAFTSVDQLTEVSGIGPATLADISPLVQV